LYPPPENTLAATYQLNLDLAPSERWKELAVKFKDPVRYKLPFIITSTLNKT